MNFPLADRTYRHLFIAQVIALAGTGLSTIALSLLAYDIAGSNAGAVLGTALAIKVVAYVVIAPIVGGFADRLSTRMMTTKARNSSPLSSACADYSQAQLYHRYASSGLAGPLTQAAIL